MSTAHGPLTLRSLYPVLAPLCLMQRRPDPARRLGAWPSLKDGAPEVPELGAGRVEEEGGLQSGAIALHWVSVVGKRGPGRGAAHLVGYFVGLQRIHANDLVPSIHCSIITISPARSPNQIETHHTAPA